MSGATAKPLATAQRDSLPWLGPIALTALMAAGMLALLGLPPVDLHSPLHRMGIMDPLCGGTRAARFFMTGDWTSAWQFNPGIFVLAAVLGLALGRWVYGLITGRWVRLPVGRMTLLIILCASLVILEINQQLHAELLMQR